MGAAWLQIPFCILSLMQDADHTQMFGFEQAA
jgi:hypothetical protein